MWVYPQLELLQSSCLKHCTLLLHHPSDMWCAMCDIARFNLNHSSPSPPSPRSASSHAVQKGTPSQPTTPRNRTSGSGATSTGDSSAVPAAESNSASTSPEDKASQHAVKLLGVYLSAQCHMFGYSPADASVTANLLPTPRVKTPCSESHTSSTKAQHPSTAHDTAANSSDPSIAAAQALRFVLMWEEALQVLVPAATLHSSYMVSGMLRFTSGRQHGDRATI